MVRKIKKFFRNIRLQNRIQRNKQYIRAKSFFAKRPFTSFFAALLVLLLLIIAGNVFANLGREETQEETPTKPVQTFSIGETPKVTLQAQAEQNGVIQIVAQSPGIIREINVKEGETVAAGKQLVSLSTNYQGGNAPALQAQLAGAQLKNVNDTYQLQKDLIGKQREVAEKTSENTEDLRKISENSVGETRGLLDLSEGILRTLNNQLTTLEQSGATEAATLQARQLKAQAEGGVVQLRGTLRNLEYQTNKDEPVNQLSNLQKDIALKQLEIQEKALELNREVSGIQYNLALVQASLMTPAAPFAAKVERINVGIGDSVVPGTVIATISCLQPSASFTVFAPRDIAANISRVEPSVFDIDGKRISIVPSYVSTVATDGQLYSIIYNVPEGETVNITNSSFLPVEIPVGYADSSSATPFIPVDSVYQSQNSTYIYVVKNNVTEARLVELGNVYGSYVEVTKGISRGDQIILNRNIVAGDKVRITN